MNINFMVLEAVRYKGLALISDKDFMLHHSMEESRRAREEERRREREIKAARFTHITNSLSEQVAYS